MTHASVHCSCKIFASIYAAAVATIVYNDRSLKQGKTSFVPAETYMLPWIRDKACGNGGSTDCTARQNPLDGLRAAAGERGSGIGEPLD
jgi:hypothetical protein